jgi:hypothetical protein
MISIKTNLEPFIDWCSFTLKFKDTDFAEFSKHVQMFGATFENNKLIIKDVAFFDRQEYLKLEFSGSFFKKKKASENMKEIDEYLTWFYNRYKFQNWFEKSTISRLDLSANDYNNTFENKFFIKTKRKQEITRFYKQNNILKGIAIGKRGKNFLYYKCYDKREDTSLAKKKACDRFGTYLFVRHEYELGRKFLREKNINFKTNFKELFNYLFDNKRIDFNYDSNRNKKIFSTIVRHHVDKERLIKQVVGIIKNNLMEERDNLLLRIQKL